MQKVLKKEELDSFINSLIKKYEFIAPVKKSNGNTKFEVIKNSKQVYLEKITDVPPKEFFIPEKEEILEFKKGRIVKPIPQKKKRIIFGMRKCDLNGLRVLDKVMLDKKYIEKRENTLLIGMFCENPDEYCFCESMELEDAKEICDLFFWPSKKEYQISVFSEKGKNLVKDLPTSKKEIELKYKNKKKLDNKNISKDYKNKIWETDAEKCLSCGACTAWCPTCNCFDLSDEININLKDGKRIRCASSCQLRSFSRVAGGRIFRDSRLSRFKHFVYHKIDYFKKQHDRYMCVGCGRCLRICPVKIDWVNTINIITNEKQSRLKPAKNFKK